MAANDLNVNNSRRLIEKIVMEIAIDIESLYKFSYEHLIIDQDQRYRKSIEIFI